MVRRGLYTLRLKILFRSLTFGTDTPWTSQKHLFTRVVFSSEMSLDYIRRRIQKNWIIVQRFNALYSCQPSLDFSTHSHNQTRQRLVKGDGMEWLCTSLASAMYSLSNSNNVSI